MSQSPTADDELAVLKRGLDRHRQYASGPATRGSGEAETRDRGGDKVPNVRTENPKDFAA
jgi:hypothetical protein